MTTIGDNITTTLDILMRQTDLKWSAQLTSKGFILYRKPRNDDYVAGEYNKWRDICSEFFNVKYEQLDDESRKNKDVHPRHWCWYMMVSVSMINVDTIVSMLNKQKNRTSILHAVRKVHSYLYRRHPEETAQRIFTLLIDKYNEQKEEVII